MHLDYFEHEEEPLRLCSVVIGESEEDTKAHFGLLQLGISPPVGTEMAHYFRVARWENEAMFVYVDMSDANLQAED